MKKLLLLAIVCVVAITMNAQLIKNDFLAGYAVNGNLEKGAYASTTQDAVTPIMINQWNLAGKTGTNDQSGVNPTVVDPLYYTNYVDSGKDFAINLLKLASGGRTSIYSLASDNTYGAGTYYLAFIFNVSTASLTSTAEFLSFDGNYTGNAQRGRLTLKGIDDLTYQVGMGDAGVATVFNSTSLNFNQTYFGVIKITIDGAGLGTSWLYINPELTSTEPTTNYATSSITGTALKSIRGVVIRQRSSLAAQIGGFRLASSWSSAIGISGTGVKQIQRNSNNITATGNTIITSESGSLKVYNLAGKEVLSSKTEGKLTTTLSKGLYLVRFVSNEGNVKSAKVELN
ncbi:MAG: T9SS type A sorting domain-containing protein [Paludibacter sp.]|nr:T9SS type A sorting domain-containing protein [Paludibacter sp.]